jgi:hypothetical protein
MDEIARRLVGWSVSLKARDAVMRAPARWSMTSNQHFTHQPSSADDNTWSTSTSTTDDSLLLFAPSKQSQPRRRLYCAVYDDSNSSYEDDDDTASTTSLADESSCSSSTSDCCDNASTRTTVVSFSNPLVTAVFVRPRTTLQQKRELYYTNFEYREFRRDYFYRKSGESLVQIHRDVVTAVHEVPVVDNPCDLYYSESDLQGYVYRTGT